MKYMLFVFSVVFSSNCVAKAEPEIVPSTLLQKPETSCACKESTLKIPNFS